MAMARTGFKLYTFRRIDADDLFLMFAVLTMTAAYTLSHFIVPIAFIQNEVSLGQITPGPSFPAQMLAAKNLETAGSAMVWTTIYAVKYSYMFFFKKLVGRVKRLLIWWRVVFAILVPISLVGSAFDFTICPYFEIDFLGMSHFLPS